MKHETTKNSNSVKIDENSMSYYPKKELKKNKKQRVLGFIGVTTIAVILSYLIINGETILNIKVYTVDKLVALSILGCSYVCSIFLISGIVIENINTYLPGQEKQFFESYKKKTIWLNSFITWLTIHYWAVGCSYLSSLIVIYVYVDDKMINNPDDVARRVILYSILAIILSVLDLLIQPFNHAKGYRKAYEMVDKGIIESVQNNDIKILINARINAEAVIGKYVFKYK